MSTPKNTHNVIERYGKCRDIASVISAADEPLASPEIAEELDLHPSSVRQLLREERWFRRVNGDQLSGTGIRLYWGLSTSGQEEFGE